MFITDFKGGGETSISLPPIWAHTEDQTCNLLAFGMTLQLTATRPGLDSFILYNIFLGRENELTLIEYLLFSMYYVRLLCKLFHLIQFHEEDCYFSFSEGEANRKVICSGFQVAEPGF